MGMEELPEQPEESSEDDKDDKNQLEDDQTSEVQKESLEKCDVDQQKQEIMSTTTLTTGNQQENGQAGGNPNANESASSLDTDDIQHKQLLVDATQAAENNGVAMEASKTEDSHTKEQMQKNSPPSLTQSTLDNDALEDLFQDKSMDMRQTM